MAFDYPGRDKLLKATKHTSTETLAPELLAWVLDGLSRVGGGSGGERVQGCHGAEKYPTLSIKCSGMLCFKAVFC